MPPLPAFVLKNDLTPAVSVQVSGCKRTGAEVGGDIVGIVNGLGADQTGFVPVGEEQRIENGVAFAEYGVAALIPWVLQQGEGFNLAVAVQVYGLEAFGRPGRIKGDVGGESSPAAVWSERS